MKLIFLDVGLMSRPFKCGAETTAFLGATSPAVASIYDTERTNAANKEMTKWQLSQQQEENQLNRDWQTSEAEKNRMFQQGTLQSAQKFADQQRLASQQYQSQQWQHQFNEELAHRFDTPSGVNPAVYWSGTSAASASGGSVGAPSGSSPSGMSGSMPGSVGGLSPVPFQAQRLDVPRLLEGITGAIENLSSAGKMDAEAKETRDLLLQKIRKAVADADSAEVGVNLAKLNLHIQQSNLPYTLKQAAANYEKTVREIELTGEKTNTEKSIQDLNKADKVLKDAMADLSSKQAEKLGLEMPYVVQYMTAAIKDKLGSAAAGYAKAEESHANAALINWEKQWREDTKGWRQDEFYESLTKLRNENLISQETLSQAKALTEQLQYNADNKEIVFWKDLILDVVTSGADAVNAFAHLKSSKAWQSMSDNQKANVERKIEQMQWEYGDKVSIEDRMPSGAKRTRTYRRKGAKFGDK